MLLFILSVNGHVQQVSAQSDIETNFELLLMTNAGNRIRESYSFFIKQAVAPLGIDVQILAKPFGQFVGDLLHLSTGQPFDLAIVGFAGGGPTPSLMWKFHSTDTSFGRFMYQLHQPAWQDWMPTDLEWTYDNGTTVPIDTAFVDNMLEEIDFELDPLERLKALDQFAEIYMDQLLYDLPLTTVTTRIAYWAGYGGDDGALLDQNEGMFASRKLGATWETNPQERQNQGVNSTTLQVRSGTPGNPAVFDPYQSFDTSTTAQTSFMTSSLLSYDGNFAAHPEVAYQWYVDDVTYDHDDNASTPDITVEDGRHTFVLNDDFEFKPTVDVDGNAVAAHPVDANDVALALDMFKHPLTNLNGKEQYGDPLVKWNVSTTVTTNDTIQIFLNEGLTTPDDYVTFGALDPIPHHLLGGDLEATPAGSDEGNDTIFQLSDHTYNPQTSVEWQHWASAEGNTLVGPMDLATYDGPQTFWSFDARDDYPFPNEWDTMEQYNSFTTELTALHDDLAADETETWDEPYAFAPHLGTNNTEAHYWAYGDDPATDQREKPTSQGLDTVVNKVIPDTNAALIAFESGQLDLFGSTALGANTVEDHENDDRFNVRKLVPVSGPTLLVFNLLNEHLKKRNVRYAIASVLDKQEMTKINDGFATPHHSPVWLVYDRFAPPAFDNAAPGGEDESWYTPFEIPFNYETGRDLMRAEGYAARENAEPNPDPEDPPFGEVISTIGGAIGSSLWIGLSAFALTSTVLVRRVRKFE